MRFFPVLVLSLFAGLALSFPLADTDIWWHLAAGREICRTRQIFSTDPFCLSSMGTNWVDLHWGFQILVWNLWRLWGNTGLVLLRIALPLLTLGLAFGRRISWSTCLAGCLCIWILRPFVDARPLLVSLLLLAVIQCAMESNTPLGRVRTALICLACQVFLSNMQGLFMLGPFLVGGFALGDWLDGNHGNSMEKLALSLGMLLSSLANPYGIHAFGLAGKLAGRIYPSPTNIFSSSIPENAPVWTWATEDPSRLVPLVWLGLAVALFWRRDQGGRARSVLLVGCGLLSIFAVRNLPLLCMEAIFCIDPLRKSPYSRFWTISAGAVALALAVQSGLQKRWDPHGSLVAPFRLPGESTLGLIQVSQSPVFHEIRAGGWLSWKLDRPGVCWADTRLVLHDAQFLSQYLEVTDHPDLFPTFARRWNFGFALLPLVEFPRFHPLAASLLGSPDWTLVDCDGAWALFQRRPGSDVRMAPKPISIDSISSHLSYRFRGNPRLVRVAREATLGFLLAGERRDLARQWMGLR